MTLSQKHMHESVGFKLKMLYTKPLNLTTFFSIEISIIDSVLHFHNLFSFFTQLVSYLY